MTVACWLHACIFPVPCPSAAPPISPSLPALQQGGVPALAGDTSIYTTRVADARTLHKSLFCSQRFFPRVHRITADNQGMLASLMMTHFAAVASASSPSSFSCAVSALTLKPGQPEYEVCVQNGTGVSNHISFQWFTGSFGKTAGQGADAVLVSFFVDGEAKASVSLFPYELAGTPSPQSYNRTLSLPHKTWSSELWGQNSATSWVNSFPVPFTRSVRITLRYTASTHSARVYYQAHGLLNAPAVFGTLPLPPTARLAIQRQELTLPRLAYLNVSHFERGAGVVAAVAIAFTAPNLNTLEGCFHFYSAASIPYPGHLHSTGTEDEFASSYYFDLGPFTSRRAGCAYISPPPHAEAGMWRTYQDDPLIFSDGGSFVWRNGDTNDPTGVKCILERGGTPAGNPQPAAVQTASWNYVW